MWHVLPCLRWKSVDTLELNSPALKICENRTVSLRL